MPPPWQPLELAGCRDGGGYVRSTRRRSFRPAMLPASQQLLAFHSFRFRSLELLLFPLL
jgi:hypothetical protein